MEIKIDTELLYLLVKDEFDRIKEFEDYRYESIFEGIRKPEDAIDHFLELEIENLKDDAEEYLTEHIVNSIEKWMKLKKEEDEYLKKKEK